jgi:molecular chaperone DnaJ
MDLRSCYAILNLPEGADLETVKKAYRRQAFKCHPDLHPEDPQAAVKFQRLNQAYVEITTSAPKTGQGAKKAKTRRARASRAYRQSSASSARSGPGAEHSSSSQQARSTSSHTSFQNEETLKNILNDPFARQVFEDIFRKVKRSKPESLRTQSRDKRLSLEWGNRSLDLDLSRFGVKGIKAWFRSQLDHEQTLYLEPGRLKPGATIRFEITRKFQDTTSTITTTIPSDYVPGRPLRLKGQGRKLGPWTGDLYLRLLTK